MHWRRLTSAALLLLSHVAAVAAPELHSFVGLFNFMTTEDTSCVVASIESSGTLIPSVDAVMDSIREAVAPRYGICDHSLMVPSAVRSVLCAPSALGISQGEWYQWE